MNADEVVQKLNTIEEYIQELIDAGWYTKEDLLEQIKENLQ